MFENIIGYSAVKNELLMFYDVMKNYKYYKQFNAPLPKGILLYGEPGVGKTLCASELVKASGRNSYIIRKNFDEVKFIDFVKSQFEQARKHTPSIIFLDDLDKFGDGRSFSGSDEYRVIQSCIDETNGFDVFIIATANDIRCFPNSLIRPGRFDRVISIDMPSGKEAEMIMAHYLSDKPIDKDVDIPNLAKILDGYSCATLESVINMASIYAGYERCELIKSRHITEAILAVVYDKPQSDFRDDMKYIEPIAYHEAGHAAISELLIPGSVTLVTIRQKHEYDNAFTKTDNSLKNMNELLNDVRILFGGKAATEIKYNALDTGARSDINNAYNILFSLIGSLGYRGFYYITPNCFTEQMFKTSEGILYQEAEKLYNEVRNILYQYYPFVDAIAQELLRKETLLAQDIANIKLSLGMM